MLSVLFLRIFHALERKNSARARNQIAATTWLVVLLPCILLYIGALRYGFSTLDDQWLIVGNQPWLEAKDVLVKSFYQPVLSIYYRPIFWISLIIDYQVFATTPAGYHAMNILLHLLAVGLLLMFLRLNNVPEMLAAGLSLLFSLHPLHLHAVAWIPGRNDVLLAVFSLASLIALIRYCRGNRPAIWWHFIFFCFALLTKETAVVLPLVFGAIMHAERIVWKKTITFFVPAWAAAMGLYLVARYHVINHEVAGVPVFSGDPLSFGGALLLYLGKLLVPLEHSVLPTVKYGMLWPGIVTTVVLISLAIRSKFSEPRRAAAGLALCLLVIALPAWFSSATFTGEQYEHRAYLALAGLALFFSQLRLKTDKLHLKRIVILLSAIYFVQGRTRLDVYRDEESFAMAGLKDHPEYHMFHQQRAVQLMERKRYGEAIDVCTKGIGFRPNYPRLYSLRAHGYYKLGMYDQSLADYDMLEKIMGPAPQISANRLAAHWHRGDLRSALVEFRRITESGTKADLPKEMIQISRQLVDSLNRLKLLADQPGASSSINYSVALMYEVMSDTSSASFYCRRALAADPANSSYRALARVLKSVDHDDLRLLKTH